MSDIHAHSTWRILTLHLLPGALITAFYFLAAPLVLRAGYPSILALLLAIIVILIPFELGYLLYQGKRTSGHFSLHDVVLYRDPLPLWNYLLFIPLLLVWMLAVFALLAPFDSYLAQTFFSWLPDWALPTTSLTTISQYPQSVLVMTFLAVLILSIAGPIVEELYFRGYLLPRIPANRAWAPLINVLLFSLYHFYSPWQNISRILAILPFVYVVSWKRNIYIGMITHAAFNTVLNILGMLATLSQIAR
jgi:membrane protease YdiL (CAAX protease family)